MHPGPCELHDPIIFSVHFTILATEPCKPCCCLLGQRVRPTRLPTRVEPKTTFLLGTPSTDASISTNAPGDSPCSTGGQEVAAVHNDVQQQVVQPLLQRQELSVVASSAAAEELQQLECRVLRAPACTLVRPPESRERASVRAAGLPGPLASAAMCSK